MSETPTPSELPEQRIKHLEMIQAVITRLGNDSFLIKGWAVTVTGVFLGFAVNSKEWGLAAVGILPALFFWALDTYYLRSERLFRVFYEKTRVGDKLIEPFGMNGTAPDFVDGLTGKDAEKAKYVKAAKRPTLAGLYCGLIAASVAVAIVLALAHGDSGNQGHQQPLKGCSHRLGQTVEHC